MKLLRVLSTCFVVLCSSPLFFAQSSAKKPAFEVASVKAYATESPADVIAQHQARGTRSGLFISGNRVDCDMALNQLIETAYRIQRYRIVGPDWLRSQWFEIHATIPEGGTRDKIPEMLQTVLEERLKLKTHFENKEEPVYAIVVQKVGAKVRLTNDASIPTEEGAKNITADGQIKGKREGETTILFDSRTGPVRTTGLSNGLTRTELMKMSLSMFAEWLTPFLDRPAVDATDLKGFYTIPLEFPPEIFRIPIMKMAGSTLPPLNTPFSNPAGQPPTSTGAAPDPSMSVKPLIDAVEKLGLKLDQRKAPYQKLVIDHVERTPVEPE